MARLLILFLLGGLAGWGLAPSPRDKEAVSNPAARVRLLDGKDGPRKELPRNREDLARWVEEQSALYKAGTGLANPTHAEELGSWTLDEIRAALNQGVTSPGVFAHGPERSALLALLGEWTKREPEAALAWLGTLPAGPLRSRLGESIANHWPSERAEEGLEKVMASVEDFQSEGSVFYLQLLRLSVESAAKRGPLAVDELVARTQQGGLKFPSAGLVFPPGFDFAGLTRTPFMADKLSLQNFVPGFVADAWLRANPDAAVSGLIALDRQQGRAPGYHLFNGLRQGSRDIASATGAALGKLPLEEQHAIFDPNGGGLKTFMVAPDNFRALIAALPDPDVRASANLTAAGRLLESYGVAAALPFIDAGSDPADRVANLEAQVMALSPSRRTRNYYSEGDVREALASWKAEPEEVERVLEVLRKATR